MTDDELARLRALLDDLPDDPLPAVRRLAQARELIDDQLNEAMARAALAGASVRSVAQEAGLAPNTVAPRMARTSVLGAYSNPSGRVGTSAIERARYDRETGRTPPRFQPRRPSTKDQTTRPEGDDR